MAPRAPVEYVTPYEGWKGTENLPQKTAGDSTNTAVQPNSGGLRSETQVTGTVRAEMGSSPDTKTNDTPVPEPKVAALETKRGISEIKDAISSSALRNTTYTSTDSSPTSTTVQLGNQARGPDLVEYHQYGQDPFPIASSKKGKNTKVHLYQSPLVRPRRRHSRPTRRAAMNREEVSPGSSSTESRNSYIRYRHHSPRGIPVKPSPPAPLSVEPHRVLLLEDSDGSEYPYSYRGPGHVLDIQIRDPAEAGETSRTERAERLRINSVPVLKILEKLTAKHFSRSFIFLRPFRFLMRQRDPLARYLAKLEKIHGNTEAGGTADNVSNSNLASEVAPENITEAKEDMEHLRCLLKFIDEECRSDFDLARAIKHGSVQKIAFKDIDLLFTAGEEIYSQNDIDNPQAYRVLATTGGRPLRKVEFAPREPVSYRRRSPDNAYAYPIPAPPPHAICVPNRDLDYDHIFRTGIDGKGESLYRRHDTASPFIIDCYSIDFDGLHLGGVQKQIQIHSYDGEKPVISLPVYPLNFLPDLEKTKERLLDRGKSFLHMINVSHKYYKGLSLNEPKEEIQSQVIVDPALALQINHNWAPKLGLDTPTERDPREANESGPACRTLSSQGSFCQNHSDPSIELRAKHHQEIFTAQAKLLDEALETQKLQDSLIILLPGRIFGFILRSRKWAQLDVTLMEDVPSREEGFNSLVLPKGHRDLVEALVQTHSRGSRPTSGTIHDKGHEIDLVRGKGKGVIILLHGAPGVGKTSTAGMEHVHKVLPYAESVVECVADFTGRPLFAITCGDIGTEPKEVEENLEKHFYLAHKWGCVLLLDEADVFLQKRDKTDLRRNSLVSVFLRVLEYYSGILFLTTNRVGMFDEAFKSRIHISLYYPPLDRKAYLAVWDMNLERTKEGKKNIQVDCAEILGYAKRHYKELRWNGRQIRNAFQTAIALAEFDAKNGAAKDYVECAGGIVHPTAKLTRQMFVKVAKAGKDFDEYLKQVYSGSNDADIAEREEVRKDNYLGHPPRRRSTFNRYRREEVRESEDGTSTGSGEDEDDSDSEDQDEDSGKERKRRKRRKGKKSKKGDDDSDDSESGEEEARTRKKAGKKWSSRR